jgi:acetyl-CoA synthetase
MSTAPLQESYPVIERCREGAHISGMPAYQQLYDESVRDPDGFWGRMAKQFLHWIRPFDQVQDVDFTDGYHAWFRGGQLNVSENCLDRHLATRGDQIAILWEGDKPGDVRRITYKELHRDVCRLANSLKGRGVRKGDRVAIYLPMIPEAAVAMLACARIGAIHSVIFGGFSAESVRDRILDSDCKVLITADEGLRGGKAVPLKNTADAALAHCPNVHTVIVHKRTGGAVTMKTGRDVWWSELTASRRPYCPAVPVDSEDILFLLYTSGSTGKPKGIAHTTAGYLLYAAMTQKYVFDVREGDLFACMADVGWVTTARCATAARPSCSKASRPTRIRAATGTWSSATGSPSSTPRRPRSARSCATAMRR